MTQTYHFEPEDDAEAWELLRPEGYKVHAGMIYHPDSSYKETEVVTEYINYLCMEWDYGFWTTTEAAKAGVINVPTDDGESLVL